MSSRPTPANGLSGDSKPSSTVKGKSGQGAQPQSTTPGKAPAKQATLKQGQTSGRPAPSKLNTAGAPGKPNTAGTSSKSNTTGAPGKPNTAGTSSKSNTTGAPGKSNTESTTSTPVQYTTWMPRERIAELSREGKQRVAKLSAEENNEAHREPSAKDALNKYKTAVEAEGKAEKAYMEIQNVIDNDSDRSGGDYYRGGMYAAPLANTWEQAARSAALAYKKFKKEAGQ